MRKIDAILFLAVLLGISYSCKRKPEISYYLKDKWRTKVLPYSTLKSKPKEVYEYLYPGVEVINQEPLPDHHSYEYFQFNDEGDLLRYTLHLSDKRSMSFRNVYNSKGYQTILYDKDSVSEEEKLVTNFEKNSEGDYQEDIWQNGAGSKKVVVRFENGGNLITRKQTIELPEYNSTAIVKLEYDGQQLLSRTIVTTIRNSKKNMQEKFYYSSDKFLDSIVKKEDGKLGKKIFINNSHGDPVQILEMENNGDTSGLFKMEYVYDSKGNWTRLLRKEIRSLDRMMKSPYELITRKIVY